MEAWLRFGGWKSITLMGWVLPLSMIFFCLPGLGQSRIYQKADAAFEQGQYGIAAQYYQQASAEAGSPAAAQARYMRAVSLLRNNASDLAIAELFALQKSYPVWPAQAQVHLLLGHTLLAQHRYSAGAGQLATILEADKTAIQADRLLYQGLSAAPPDTVARLARLYPKSRALLQRRQLGRALSDNGHLGTDVSRGPKAAHRIALVLPLEMDKTLGSVAAKANLSMAELLAGALEAIIDLEVAGKPVELAVYDTHKSDDSLSALLAIGELAQADLIVGPVYAQGTEQLARYAAQAKVPMLNPLSTQARWAQPNTMAYLAEADAASQAAAVLAMAGSGPTAKVACIYGVKARDTMLATAFARQARGVGKSMQLYKQVAKNSAANLTKFIREAELDSNSVLFVPNEEPLVRAQLMSALEITRCAAKVVTYGEWLEEADIPLDRFERERIRFLYPGYVDSHPIQTQALKERLAARLGLPATEIAFKGYDLVKTLGATLYSLPDRQSGFLRDFSPFRSELSAGYDFAESQSNSRVAIYRMVNGSLEHE